jgi:hypothetical protein
MNWRASWEGRAAKALFGFAFHAALAILGGLTLGFIINFGTSAIARNASKEVQDLVEFLPFISFERISRLVRNIQMVQPLSPLGRVVRIGRALGWRT